MKVNAIPTLDVVIDRLSAWADTAEMIARHKPDSEAEPFTNRAINYRELVRGLDHVRTRYAELLGEAQ